MVDPIYVDATVVEATTRAASGGSGAMCSESGYTNVFRHSVTQRLCYKTTFHLTLSLQSHVLLI